MTVAFKSKCPFCRHCHDLASAVEGGDAAPKDGDVSLCVRCGKIAVFAMEHPHLLREPTRIEQTKFDIDPLLVRLKATWRRTLQ